jgi:hypothetical protein
MSVVPIEYRGDGVIVRPLPNVPIRAARSALAGTIGSISDLRRTGRVTTSRPTVVGRRR